MMITTGYKTKPDLRFPMFLDDWSYLPLRELAEKKIKKNKNGKFSNVYTNSAIKGVIAQQDYFSKDIANQENLTGYYIVEKNDFVYNPRISVSAPVGPIKRNHLKTGVMSPLYTIFELRKSQYTNFLEFYFENCSWHRYMCSVANYGARHDRMNISSSDFFNLPIALPISDEARKIANFLSSIDKKTQQLTEKQSLLQQYKKGIMQKLFSQEIRFKDERGNDFPDWEEKALGTLADKINNKNKDEAIKNVLTNSAKRGIINQTDYFDKSIANQNNLGGYYIVEKNDFVYNPRISEAAPVGPIKRNKLFTGVMSPLYTVFRFQDDGYLTFFELYFETTFWHRYMKGIANYGARHDRMNITMGDFMKLPLPYPSKSEMQKIIKFINAIDSKLAIVTEQIEQTKTFKKGLLQQMFV